MDHLVPQERNEAISTLSEIAYSFMGSQALFAALELSLFTILADEPCALDDLTKRRRVDRFGQAQSYTIEELCTAMQEAGFTNVVILILLPDLTFLLSGRKS